MTCQRRYDLTEDTGDARYDLTEDTGDGRHHTAPGLPAVPTVGTWLSDGQTFQERGDKMTLSYFIPRSRYRKDGDWRAIW